MDWMPGKGTAHEPRGCMAFCLLVGAFLCWHPVRAYSLFSRPVISCSLLLPTPACHLSYHVPSSCLQSPDQPLPATYHTMCPLLACNRLPSPCLPPIIPCASSCKHSPAQPLPAACAVQGAPPLPLQVLPRPHLSRQRPKRQLAPRRTGRSTQPQTAASTITTPSWARAAGRSQRS